MQTISVAKRLKEAQLDPSIIRRGVIQPSTKHKHNLKCILLFSNANPIRNKNCLGYACSFCPEQLPEAWDLKNHFLNEHNDEKQITDMCGKVLQVVVKLDITCLNCSICDLDLPGIEELLIHLKKEHELFVFTDIEVQFLPVKFETPGIRCFVCQTEYMTFKLLQEHMVTHFGQHICTECGHAFMNERHLSNHWKRGHKLANLKCDQCDKVFDTKSKMRGHQLRTHLGRTKRSKCHLCNERFAGYWKKVTHMVKEHGAPPVVLKCQACDKNFSNQRALSKHTRKHHLLERRHKCNECEKSFYCTSSLKEHMTKHTGLKLYQCDVCSKSFARRFTLIQHLRIHADDRRYACEFCGRAFVQKYSWRSHLQSQHGQVC